MWIDELKMDDNKSKNVKTRSYCFSLSIIRLVNLFPHKNLYWIIGDQILRSATSIGANIMEAQSTSSRKDFIRFYHYSLKSGNETHYWLCILREAKLVPLATVDRLIDEIRELNSMLAAALITLKK